MEEKINKTIESVCDAVQEMMESKVRKGEIATEYSSMVSALAELIKANAEYKVADLKAKGPLDNYLPQLLDMRQTKRGGVRNGMDRDNQVCCDMYIRNSSSCCCERMEEKKSTGLS